MSDWDVNLELVDGKSKKFWRARVDGGDVAINYGRIGTNGQSQTKSFGDEDTARSELDKLARAKRKKGYADADGAAPAPAEAAAPEASIPAAKEISLSLDESGRRMSVHLAAGGGVLRTVVEERYEDDDQALAALERVATSLQAGGYRAGKG